MAKNILIFSDGTGQAGGLIPDQHLSNVYKLYRATRVGPDNAIDPDAQVAFYDAGLGTDVDAASVRLRIVRRLRKIASSATGTGLGRTIVDARIFDTDKVVDATVPAEFDPAISGAHSSSAESPLVRQVESAAAPNMQQPRSLVRAGSLALICRLSI